MKRLIKLLVALVIILVLDSCKSLIATSVNSRGVKIEKKTPKRTPKKTPKKHITNGPNLGKELFDANACAACHNKTARTVGPSVMAIAKFYKGKKNDLIKFLNGKSDAIIDPPNFPIMQPMLNVTKKLSDAERVALADYILSVK